MIDTLWVVGGGWWVAHERYVAKVGSREGSKAGPGIAAVTD
jgi:hypothetical protein